MKKDKKIIQSAKFKRDYVTYLALGLFGFMVVCEIIVALSIHFITKHSSLYSAEELKHNVISKFDVARRRSNPNKKDVKNSEDNADELTLIRWDLDLVALELREKQYDMDKENLKDMLKVMNHYQIFIDKLNDDTNFSYHNGIKELDFDTPIDNALEKIKDRNK